MRFYRTKSISDILKRVRQGQSGLLSTLEQQKELYKLWDELPDARMRKIKVTFEIKKGEAIRIICPSPMTYNYIRQKRQLLEEYFANYIEANAFAGIEIALK